MKVLHSHQCKPPALSVGYRRFMEIDGMSSPSVWGIPIKFGGYPCRVWWISMAVSSLGSLQPGCALCPFWLHMSYTRKAGRKTFREYMNWREFCYVDTRNTLCKTYYPLRGLSIYQLTPLCCLASLSGSSSLLANRFISSPSASSLLSSSLSALIGLPMYCCTM